MSLAKVLILAEERLLGLGVASLLSRQYDTCTTESADGAAAIAAGERPDLVLWLGERLDAEAAGELLRLRQGWPALRLCVLARAADTDALRAVLSLNGREVAVLHRNRELDVASVLQSVESVLAGHARLEPAAIERLVASDRQARGALGSLTASEHEVLALVAEGLRNREIARRVWKSEKAVEKRVSSVFHKLGLAQETAHDLDRRVTAARIFYASRPESISSEPGAGASGLEESS